MYQKLPLIFLLSFLIHSVKSQTVTGQINDESAKSVQFANVTLHRAADSVFVKAALSDEQGRFTLENVAMGRFFVRVTQVGYQRFSSPAFVLNTETPNVNLRSIQLIQDAKNLNEVTVRTTKPFIERQLDKTIVNVENSIVSAGSNALEVLERSPGVVVDQNDNISLKGKQGVMVMINGKPSIIASQDLANYLRGLPANTLEKIEIITNPSAKYDAAGNAGILNLVMKKDQRLGTNGTINLSYGQGVYAKTSEGITFNHRNKKLNLFGNYNFAYRKAFSHLVLDRRFYKDGILDGVFDQDNYITFPFKNHTGRLGADYAVSKKTLIGAVISGLSNRFNPTGDTRTGVLNQDLQLVRYDLNSNRSKENWFNFAINTNLKHTFDSTGRELTVDLDYAHYGNRTDQRFTTEYVDTKGNQLLPTYVLLGDVLGKLDIKSLKADYVHPLPKKAKVEAGLKSSFVRADNDLKYYIGGNEKPVFDPSQSNHFIYDENINAAYVNYAKQFDKVNFQLGLRMEQNNIKGNQLATNITFDSTYTRLFPSAFLNYKFSRKHEWSFSVSRRLDRPSYRQLNPFKFYINNSTYSEGNPYLQPQFTYSFEIAHHYNQQITTTFSYSQTVNNITEVIMPLEGQDKVTVQTNRNLTEFQFWGINISASTQVTKWWNSVNNINTYYSTYKGNVANTPLRNGNANININSNNSFVLGKKGYVAELSVIYRAREIYGFMDVQPTGQVSLGIQKTFWDRKATLKLNGTDLFYTSIGRATVTFKDYVEKFRVNRETRVATLSFSYRFGNNKVQAGRRRSSGVEEEKQRAGNS
ncbi:TonB-dependent receptor domain-containing protein [Runella sp.]|uniref:TonB-dependent receptor domain-containing protein n=1 Tax=Runella sp. TaxID=1960881 RepID=UPI003D0C0108